MVDSTLFAGIGERYFGDKIAMILDIMRFVRSSFSLFKDPYTHTLSFFALVKELSDERDYESRVVREGVREQTRRNIDNCVFCLLARTNLVPWEN
jgi:hypothetical protein